VFEIEFRRHHHFRQVGLERFHKVPHERARNSGEVGDLLLVRPERRGGDGGLAVSIGTTEELLPLQLGAAVQGLEPPVGLALQVVEQVALGRVALLVQEQKVRVGVCPPQHPPAIGDLPVRLGHEPELHRREVHQPGHPLELRPLQLVRVRERLLQRLAVARPPLVVVQVPVQRRLGLPPPRLFLVRGGGLQLLPLAVIVARAAPVVVPGVEAEPAELVAAGGAARHVVAAVVLLDRPPALGAALGVGHHPVGRLRVGGVLGQPRAHRGARHRPVLCRRLA